jgi:hypothetical protein
MRKIYLFLLLGVFVLVGAGCGQTPDSVVSLNQNKQLDQINQIQPVEPQVEPQVEKSAIDDVCTYFNQELITQATGITIVKVDNTSVLGNDVCTYYTEYKDNYFVFPDGKLPGGPNIVAVIENQDVEIWKADKIQSGNTLEQDPRIVTDNYVVKSGDTIWQVVIILAPDKFLRISANHFAADAVPDLVKISAKFAVKIKSQE